MNTQTIYRHVVPVDDQPHTIAHGKIFYVGSRSPEIVEFWASDQNPEWHEYQVSGTGHPVPEDWQYIGSAITANGALVWHLWETS